MWKRKKTQNVFYMYARHIAMKLPTTRNDQIMQTFSNFSQTSERKATQKASLKTLEASDGASSIWSRKHCDMRFYGKAMKCEL